MRDPIITYSRIIEDLENIAAATPRERLDPRLWYEIKEAKEELSRLQGQTDADADVVLVPAIRKCYRCGKTTTTTDLCCL
jgi:hypothetical protein